ncbi:hypothetical protein BVC71_03740 [Marivivens niveibacter]|uniref:Chemotaxis protein CheA n=1 Tax=Marivivens niveibacter TaxID=1930667 RepID=A0A251X2R4_9RHOB|nr:chemotaxis protein CheA [Marivivens niveibacter]OUD10614.1 hypothetical protein BVC71_03740 [Marivivens niveibacter]
MNSLLDQFVSECRDLIETSSRALLALETDTENPAQINELFRAIHTIKGASGLFDFKPLTSCVHAGEDLLDAVRAGDVAFNSGIADLLLEMLDRLVEWLDSIEDSETLPSDAQEISAALSTRLRDYISDGAGVNDADDTSQQTEVAAPWPDDIPVLEGAETGLSLITYTPGETTFFAGGDPLRTVLAAPGLLWMQVVQPDDWPDVDQLDPFMLKIGFRLVSSATVPDLEKHFSYDIDDVSIERIAATDGPSAIEQLADDILQSQAALLATPQTGVAAENIQKSAADVVARVGRNLNVSDDAVGDLDATIADVRGEPAGNDPAPVDKPQVAEPEKQPAAAPAKQRSSGYLRVDSDRIDALMNLAGELIVAKNAMPFLARKAENIEDGRELVREIKMQHNTINRIAEELQAAIMQIRMVPVGSVLSRFNRLVRDMSRKLGKDIRYVVDGEDTEADKAIVDELSDPIVHLIRNSIDHGIEDPTERAEADKPKQGTIRVSAFNKDDSVVIEITDDGKGIAVDKVVKKALERGLIDAERVNAMSANEKLQLIFLPGLSTKEEVSDLSGRGVGMDVVASMVRRLGGQISIDSEPGLGARVTLSLPLSMAVQQLMMVEVGDGLYGVPVDSVVESQKISPVSIRRHRDAEMVLLRDRLIPLVRMRDLFQCDAQDDPETLSVMVVDVNGHESGLVVDRFHPGVDAIVKPMSGVLANYDCYSGTALLGDGSILLALNLREIVECQYH